MKVLFLGDLHGNLTFLRTAVDAAVREGCTHIVQAGDFGFFEPSHDGVEFLDKASQYLEAHGVTLQFVDGNHDHLHQLQATYTDTDPDGLVVVREQIRYAPRSHQWTLGGLRVGAFGGAYSTDKAWRLKKEEKLLRKAAQRNAGRRQAGLPPVPVESAPLREWWFPEEEATQEDLDRALQATDGVDILITHDKPRSSAPPVDLKTMPECLAQQDKVQQVMVAWRPKLLVHGHLHRRYVQEIRTGDDTWCTVVGLGSEPRGCEPACFKASHAMLVIDTANPDLGAQATATQAPLPSHASALKETR